MAKVRPWHLLSNATDVQNCQYNPAFNDGTYRFEGALVLGDTVYDGSMRSRLQQLRARLRERCLNEVQRGRDRFRHPEGN